MTARACRVSVLNAISRKNILETIIETRDRIEIYIRLRYERYDLFFSILKKEAGD